VKQGENEMTDEQKLKTLEEPLATLHKTLDDFKKSCDDSINVMVRHLDTVSKDLLIPVKDNPFLTLEQRVTTLQKMLSDTGKTVEASIKSMSASWKEVMLPPPPRFLKFIPHKKK
jgi:regulator of replication initiation timing